MSPELSAWRPCAYLCGLRGPCGTTKWIRLTTILHGPDQAPTRPHRHDQGCGRSGSGRDLPGLLTIVKPVGLNNGRCPLCKVVKPPSSGESRGGATELGCADFALVVRRGHLLVPRLGGGATLVVDGCRAFEEYGFSGEQLIGLSGRRPTMHSAGTALPRPGPLRGARRLHARARRPLRRPLRTEPRDRDPDLPYARMRIRYVDWVRLTMGDTRRGSHRHPPPSSGARRVRRPLPGGRLRRGRGATQRRDVSSCGAHPVHTPCTHATSPAVPARTKKPHG